MNKGKTIITGSGVSALMLARMILKYKNPQADITIIEREDKIGGQFGSIDYGPHGFFDYGMHIYYESCVPEIDELFTSLLPESEWNILEGNYKDAAGIFWNGKLQPKCPYPDLRAFSEEKLGKYISDLFITLKDNFNNSLNRTDDAYSILSSHFGKLIADEIFVPILQKLYLNHSSCLDEIAVKLTAINRVAIFDEQVMLDLMKSPSIRARICYPNQYTLPACRTNTQRGFYPKKYGMFRVLNKFKSSLEKDGVKFLTSSSVSDIQLENNSIQSLKIKNLNSEHEINGIDEVYWTAGLPPLAQSLKIDLSGLKNDRREAAVYVNLLFDKKPEMDLLYYFYCFDNGFRTFRVTNYANYCPGANESRGFPLCVELWPEQGDAQDENSIIERAMRELKSFGVINDAYRLEFSKVEKVHGGGFPLPTINNISNMNNIRDKIKNLEITNLISIGVLSEKNIFFIKDILIDAYEKVTDKKLKLI